MNCLNLTRDLVNSKNKFKFSLVLVEPTDTKLAKYLANHESVVLFCANIIDLSI